MVREREGGWVQTINGNVVYPLDPRPEEIFIEDIAWALSMQCRFSGHVLRFMSVAEHSIHVSTFCSPSNKRAGLLHDASEAYLSDMMRPIKQRMPEYKAIEDRLMEVIAERFDFIWPLDPEVKDVDTKMLFTERKAILPQTGHEWENEQPGFDAGVIQCWTPHRAYNNFMKSYHSLK